MKTFLLFACIFLLASFIYALTLELSDDNVTLQQDTLFMNYLCGRTTQPILPREVFSTLYPPMETFSFLNFPQLFVDRQALAYFYNACVPKKVWVACHKCSSIEEQVVVALSHQAFYLFALLLRSYLHTLTKSQLSGLITLVVTTDSLGVPATLLFRWLDFSRKDVLIALPFIPSYLYDIALERIPLAELARVYVENAMKELFGLGPFIEHCVSLGRVDGAGLPPYKAASMYPYFITLPEREDVMRTLVTRNQDVRVGSFSYLFQAVAYTLKVKKFGKTAEMVYPFMADPQKALVYFWGRSQLMSAVPAEHAKFVLFLDAAVPSFGVQLGTCLAALRADWLVPFQESLQALLPTPPTACLIPTTQIASEDFKTLLHLKLYKDALTWRSVHCAAYLEALLEKKDPEGVAKLRGLLGQYRGRCRFPKLPASMRFQAVSLINAAVLYLLTDGWFCASFKDSFLGLNVPHKQAILATARLFLPSRGYVSRQLQFRVRKMGIYYSTPDFLEGLPMKEAAYQRFMLSLMPARVRRDLALQPRSSGIIVQRLIAACDNENYPCFKSLWLYLGRWMPEDRRNAVASFIADWNIPQDKYAKLIASTLVPKYK